MHVEYKAYGLKLDGPPDAEGRFSGMASAFGNVDKGGDVVGAGAFTKTLLEQPVVPVLWMHDPTEPIGVSVTLEQTAGGLKIEGQLVMDVQRAREAHALMAAGAVKGLSIGYKVVTRSFKGAVRHLHELKLVEVSLVPFPMNTLATISAVKAAGAKGYGLYGDVSEAQCLMSMMMAGLDYLCGEVSEGDADGVAAMQTILGLLSDLLAAELVEVSVDANDQMPAPDDGADDPYTGMMAEPIRHAIKRLGALLERSEPTFVTPPTEDAAPDAKTEPGIAATLTDLARAIRGHSLS